MVCNFLIMRKKRRKDLEIPDNLLLAMIAIGRRSRRESIQICRPNFKREYPDDRNPLGYIVMKGKFVK
jgi:hypothetical protein